MFPKLATKTSLNYSNVSQQINELFPSILSVGTATPLNSYTQKEVLDLLNIDDRRTRLMFLNSAIDKRYLSLPLDKSEQGYHLESQGELLTKHKEQALEVGSRALFSCLDKINAQLNDVRSLCCVTSTGMLTPGLSALLCQKLGLRHDCNRLDIVGMGCNAGLNGLNASAHWSSMHPGELSIMLCIEMCSAAYVVDGKIETSVVNSLFGDGASAASIFTSKKQNETFQARILNFSSHIIPEAMDAMRFDWDDEQGKFSFFLARDVPYVIGANIEEAVGRLLKKSGVRKSDINHWIIHSGGKKVIDSIKVNLGLTTNDVRHTTSVLRDYGNVSSGSFLFSYERLEKEEIIEKGDFGVMITMGPGATIETALIHWS